jgi:hypothetical protein
MAWLWTGATHGVDVAEAEVVGGGRQHLPDPAVEIKARRDAWKYEFAS